MRRSVTGGGTNFSIATRLGSGQSDLFQARPRTWAGLLPIEWSKSSSNQKNENVLAIATLAAIADTTVALLIRKLR
jgi:hypothetical protein